MGKNLSCCNLGNQQNKGGHCLLSDHVSFISQHLEVAGQKLILETQAARRVIHQDTVLKTRYDELLISVMDVMTVKFDQFWHF